MVGWIDVESYTEWSLKIPPYEIDYWVHIIEKSVICWGFFLHKTDGWDAKKVVISSMIMFQCIPYWFQDPIFKQSSTNPGLYVIWDPDYGFCGHKIIASSVIDFDFGDCMMLHDHLTCHCTITIQLRFHCQHIPNVNIELSVPEERVAWQGLVESGTVPCYWHA